MTIFTGDLMIRLATIEDMPELLRMGKSFFDASGYGNVTCFNSLDAENLLITLIENECVLTDGKNGMIGFVVFPLFFNSTYKLSQELFWWVDKNERKGRLGISLLKAAEKKSKEKGADSMIMLSINDLDGNKINRIYEATGYSRQEQSYMRSL